MSFKFEKLIVWQEAMDLGEEVNRLSFTFPSSELYNLSSQIRSRRLHCTKHCGGEYGYQQRRTGEIYQRRYSILQ